MGLCEMLAARRLGAEQIISVGRHTAPIDFARSFGPTDVVAERAEAAIAAVRRLTEGGYIPGLLADLLDGTIDPSPRFDRAVILDGVSDGYRAIEERMALKVGITL